MLRFSPLVRDYSQVTDEDLVVICVDIGDQQAWYEFQVRFMMLVRSTVRRVAHRYSTVFPDECDDLTQIVLLKLCEKGAKRLRGFQPRGPGSARGYLSVVTANIVHDYFRSERPPLPPIEGDAPGPDINLDRTVLLDEIEAMLRPLVSEKELRIFRLYYRHGMTAKEIAAIPYFGLTESGVESVIVRLNRLGRKHIFREGSPRGKSVSKKEGG